MSDSVTLEPKIVTRSLDAAPTEPMTPPALSIPTPTAALCLRKSRRLTADFSTVMRSSVFKIVSITHRRHNLLHPGRYIICDLLPPGLCDNPVGVIIELPIRGDSLVFFRDMPDNGCRCDPVPRSGNDQDRASHFCFVDPGRALLVKEPVSGLEGRPPGFIDESVVDRLLV